MYHLPLQDNLKLRTRRVNEQAFKNATNGGKVSLRSATSRYPLKEQQSCENLITLNSSHNKTQLAACQNCKNLQDQLKYLREENSRLKENIEKNKEDSGKLDTLYIEIAKAKDRMAMKLISKQDELMNILNFSRIIPERQTDPMSTVRDINQLTRMTSCRELKPYESTGV